MVLCTHCTVRVVGSTLCIVRWANLLLFTILEIYQGDARKQILKIQSITVFIFCLSNFFFQNLFSKMFVLCEILKERNE